MAAGDIDFTHALFVVDGLTETNVAIAKGALVEFNTDGWDEAVAVIIGAPGPYGVSLDVLTATAATQKAIRVLIDGVVEILKVAGALVQGQAVMPTATPGQVGVWAITDAGAAYNQAAANLSITESAARAGTTIVDAAGGDAVVKTLVGW